MSGGAAGSLARAALAGGELMTRCPAAGWTERVVNLQSHLLVCGPALCMIVPTLCLIVPVLDLIDPALRVVFPALGLLHRSYRPVHGGVSECRGARAVGGHDVS